MQTLRIATRDVTEGVGICWYPRVELFVSSFAEAKQTSHRSVSISACRSSIATEGLQQADGFHAK